LVVPALDNLFTTICCYTLNGHCPVRCIYLLPPPPLRTCPGSPRPTGTCLDARTFCYAAACAACPSRATPCSNTPNTLHLRLLRVPTPSAVCTLPPSTCTASNPYPGMPWLPAHRHPLAPATCIYNNRLPPPASCPTHLPPACHCRTLLYPGSASKLAGRQRHLTGYKRAVTHTLPPPAAPLPRTCGLPFCATVVARERRGAPCLPPGSAALAPIPVSWRAGRTAPPARATTTNRCRGAAGRARVAFTPYVQTTVGLPPPSPPPYHQRRQTLARAPPCHRRTVRRRLAGLNARARRRTTRHLHTHLTFYRPPHHNHNLVPLWVILVGFVPGQLPVHLFNLPRAVFFVLAQPPVRLPHHTIYTPTTPHYRHRPPPVGRSTTWRLPSPPWRGSWPFRTRILPFLQPCLCLGDTCTFFAGRAVHAAGVLYLTPPPAAPTRFHHNRHRTPRLPLCCNLCADSMPYQLTAYPTLPPTPLRYPCHRRLPPRPAVLAPPARVLPTRFCLLPDRGWAAAGCRHTFPAFAYM